MNYLLVDGVRLGGHLYSQAVQHEYPTCSCILAEETASCANMHTVVSHYKSFPL